MKLRIIAVLLIQYLKYRVGKCVSIHVYVYLHIHMCFLTLRPTLPLFQATLANMDQMNMCEMTGLCIQM